VWAASHPGIPTDTLAFVTEQEAQSQQSNPREPGAEPWPAPFADHPVTARVVVPGSKSATNRALVLAALAGDASRLARPLRSRDTRLMAGALRSLGATIDDEPGGGWLVIPAGLHGDCAIDVGNAGTVMRFLPPVAALADGSVSFDGDPRSHERPIGELLGALRALGARIQDDGTGHLPMTVHGAGGLPGGLVEMDASRSSQFVSALLLAGARFDRGVEVRHVGARLPSAPHIAMTVDMLREVGAQVDDSEPARWRVAPGALRGHDTVVEPDLSNAAPFLAAAMVTGGSVTIADWPEHTTQPGDQLRDIFGAMGARCELTPDGLVLRSEGRIRGIDVDLHDVGELTPVIAAVAALADSASRLRGIGHLRLHETDRLAALAKELNALGGQVTEGDDELIIEPRPLSGGVFATYDDHRLATAAAVLGLVVPGVRVEDIGTTGKTLPDFPGLWHAMLAGQEYVS
jgi:3-phosphoshikimate 1-carboxyvinyltransferase